MRPESALDWHAPDYTDVYRARAARLDKLRTEPQRLAYMRAWYKDNPADFINDWGMTVDPRNAERGLPVVVPFVLFPKQHEFVRWIVDGWHSSQGGLMEKSRDMGASWLAMATACTLCIFHTQMMIGFGSAKEDKVDRSDDPDALFYKGREFMRYLPPEFRAGYDPRKHAVHMRMSFPLTKSSITGEAGDNIGRGGRKAIFFVDEAAHIERPKLVDASLAATTNCRVDMSSVNGMANSFAEKRHRVGTRVFSFHYRDDPRKDAAWRAKKVEELDAVTWAAEYEMDYRASVEGIIIPAAWVEAAVDAHRKLGVEPTGAKRGALDIADMGADKNGFAAQHGIVVTHLESWRGSADLDTFKSVERAFALCDNHGCEGLIYDADGLGAAVRGDSVRINEDRKKAGVDVIKTDPHRGSGSVFAPERVVPGTTRKAKDYFENYKAQAWRELREKFRVTFKALTEPGYKYDPSSLISLSGSLRELPQLKVELSQPTWVPSKTGKWMVEKAPEGTMSPNLGDCIAMLNAPRMVALKIHPGALAAMGAR